MAVKPIPDDYHTVTPYLCLRDCRKAMEFYKTAPGAEVLFTMDGPGGAVMHGEMKIGDSPIMFSEECPEWGQKSPLSLGGTPCSLHVYVADVDAAFQRAVAAGCTVKMPPADMFWGDRFAKLEDPFGHQWSLATHKEDVSPAEMQARGKAWMEQMAAQKK
jgi:PhnB protein